MATLPLICRRRPETVGGDAGGTITAGFASNGLVMTAGLAAAAASEDDSCCDAALALGDASLGSDDREGDAQGDAGDAGDVDRRPTPADLRDDDRPVIRSAGEDDRRLTLSEFSHTDAGADERRGEPLLLLLPTASNSVPLSSTGVTTTSGAIGAIMGSRDGCLLMSPDEPLRLNLTSVGTCSVTVSPIGSFQLRTLIGRLEGEFALVVELTDRR